MLPKVSDIEVPLLQSLAEVGGQCKPQDLYPLITRRFPEIRVEELAETLPSGPNRWINRIQWTRQALVENEQLDSPRHGIWRITGKGMARLSGQQPDGHERPPTFYELLSEYESSVQTQLLERLTTLTPMQFQHFARRLLTTYDFVDVRVGRVGRDGGIDGTAKFRLGLATMDVAYQCKRWEGNVPRPEIDRFRGAIQGRYEMGFFFTTSDFTAEARSAGAQEGAIRIVLVNGNEIVKRMIDRDLGVRRAPLYRMDVTEEDFSEIEEG